jgi:ubiquinone/menaquinone biosynthesis C-methylase UbiE
MSYDVAVVKDHWSEVDCSASEKNFYCFPAIRTRSCQLIFNETDATRKDWCQYYTVEKYLRRNMPFDKCLSICCGFGEVERTLAKLHVARKIVGTDIAHGAIEEAKKRAMAEDMERIIEYYAADLNSERLPADSYDLIWANGALHHIANLERVVSELYSALQGGGYLVSNEYVGPKYQQIGARQQEIVNAAKHLLPPELRNGKVFYKPCGNSLVARAIRYARRKLQRHRSGQIYETLWERPPVGYFLSTDPSECVSSDRIIPILKHHFKDIEVLYFNGSILQYALDAKFYDNFDSHNTKHHAALQMLFELEDAFATTGELSQDNAHIICRKATDS